jgi:hypothetical protein
VRPDKNGVGEAELICRSRRPSDDRVSAGITTAQYALNKVSTAGHSENAFVRLVVHPPGVSSLFPPDPLRHAR